MNSFNPSIPYSAPKPDCLCPPNGANGEPALVRRKSEPGQISGALEDALPRLGTELGATSVSGLSSGAYMAGQIELAPVEGERYAGAVHKDSSYQRIGRTIGLDRLTDGQVKKQLDYVSLDRRAQIMFVLRNPTNPWIAGTGIGVARDAQDLYRNLSGVSFFSYAGVTARGMLLPGFGEQIDRQASEGDNPQANDRDVEHRNADRARQDTEERIIAHLRSLVLPLIGDMQQDERLQPYQARFDRAP